MTSCGKQFLEYRAEIRLGARFQNERSHEKGRYVRVEGTKRAAGLQQELSESKRTVRIKAQQQVDSNESGRGMCNNNGGEEEWECG